MERLQIIDNLVSLLEEEVGKNYSKNFLYPYIMSLEDNLGSEQYTLELIAKRLTLSLSYSRYDQTGSDPWNEGITLREVIYYEFWYLLKYGLPWIRQKGWSVEGILEMSYSEFKPIFQRLYPNQKYDLEHYQHRLSYLTDYAQERLQK